MKSKHQTLRQLEGAASFRGSGSSLDQWYLAIRDTALDVLSAGDLARAVRQRLSLEAVLPEAVERLQMDPYGGDVYDGELLVSLRNVPAELWMVRGDLRNIICDIIKSLDYSRFDGDSLRDIDDLKHTLGAKS